MSWTRVLPVFSIAYIVSYVPIMFWNWPVFTYVPRTKQFYWGLFQPVGTQAPGMFYFGWLITAGLVAAIVAAIALALPEKALERLVPVTWIAALAMLGVELFILREWFV